MVRTLSTMLEIGTPLPLFSLPGVDGKIISSGDFSQHKGLLVVFLCNHCPFVKHLAPELAQFAKEVLDLGIGMVGINSNDVENYPADSFENMQAEASQRGYIFPYLFDETQEVAKMFRAACTPDFYLFDSKFKLYYRGQFDESRPSTSIPVTGKDLREALSKMAKQQTYPEAEQKPSLGCNIKWKKGNEPDYFGG